MASHGSSAPSSSLWSAAGGLTYRSSALGFGIGTLLTFSNTYFGLQTGWVSMSSLQSALLSFGIVRVASHARPGAVPPLTIAEHVLATTISTASATMPLAAGFVGIIPALRVLQSRGEGVADASDLPLQSAGAQIVWSLSVCFLGVFVAVPLRAYLRVLRFPSGTATAVAIESLHRSVAKGEVLRGSGGGSSSSGGGGSIRGLALSTCDGGVASDDNVTASGASNGISSSASISRGAPTIATKAAAVPDVKPTSQIALDGVVPASSCESTSPSPVSDGDSEASLRVVWLAFAASAGLALAGFLLPVLGGVPVLTWVGLPAASSWSWVLTLSLSYVGQGMIMGLHTCLSMALGAVVAWGIIGPAAGAAGWVIKPLSSSSTGGRGFLLWVALAILLSEAATSAALALWGLVAPSVDADVGSSGAAPLPRAGKVLLPTATEEGEQKGGESGGLGGREDERRREEREYSKGARMGGAAAGAALAPPGSNSSSVPMFLPGELQARGEPLLGHRLGLRAAAEFAAQQGYDMDGLRSGGLLVVEDWHGEPPQDAALRSGGVSHCVDHAPSHTEALVDEDESATTKAPTAFPSPSDEEVLPTWLWTSGLAASCAVAVVALMPLAHVSFAEAALSVALTLPISVVSVRCLGETDLNPVSGLGKVTQLVFGALFPANLIGNVIAGAVAEAGAQQAGDLMQDLKMGSLLHAPLPAQFTGQVLGSLLSVFTATIAFHIFDSAYGVPSLSLPAPTAALWVSMAEVMGGQGSLPAHVLPFAIAGAALAAVCTLATSPHAPRMCVRAAPYVPSPTAVSIGMYVTANWTIPRLVGALAAASLVARGRATQQTVVMLATGFVLGEGCMALVAALLTTAGARPLSCAGCAQGLCGNWC